MAVSSLMKILTVFLAACVFAAPAFAQRGGGGGRNVMPAPKGTHVVVQVENQAAIIRKSQVSWYKQQLGTLYLRESQQWKEARKAAKANKVKFTEKKPSKKKLKVVNANSKTEEAARKILDALIARSAKSKKGKVEEGSVLGEAAERGRGRDRRAGRDRNAGKDARNGKDAKNTKNGKGAKDVKGDGDRES